MASGVQVYDIAEVGPEDLVVATTVHRLPESASLLLDVIRFSAALLVVAAHIGHVEITTGFRDRQVLGQVAVPIFFVLSGFVIRFVTRSREHSLGQFLIDRAARMYSVILPGMVLTIAASAASFALAPNYYRQSFGAFSSHPVERILLNLVFLSQSWGRTVIPFCNLPFWSLSYECLYYLGFGLWFFMRGRKRVLALVLWAALAGPQVMFLLPVWWLGCWVYDVYSRVRKQAAGRVLRLLALAYLGVGAVASVFGNNLVFGAPALAVRAFSRLPHPLVWLHVEPQRATLMAFGTGVLAAGAMLLLLLLSDLVRLERGSVWVRQFRRVADGTFCIYLMHYPLMVLATAAGFYRVGHAVENLLITGFLCGLLILAARPADWLKVRLRGIFTQLFHVEQLG